ncbi:U2 snRNP-associated SURP motif-containing protein [Paramyrothecium foliicola]|nr:U2 snRNP-associated SURP motif-containing protein [Paramyrothecium foliicola]
MSSSKGLPSFPDVEAKLQKPTKQSAFEKQKAEAEAKRQREAAETAAVYEDFVKSFDRDDDGPSRPGGSTLGQPRARPGFGAGGPSAPSVSKRHFGTSALKSGPGSLGPPPSSFGKKRSFQDFSSSRGSRERGVLGFDEHEVPSTSVPRAFDASDDEDTANAADRAEERAIAKPTLRLSSLPPGTSPAMVKGLIPESLSVENVKMLPPASHGGTERKCAVAIVTLSQETPANDIDGAVSALQNRYLGFGYHLSLHRHLSSAVASSTALPNLALGTSGSASHPFGAKPVEQPSATNNAPIQQGFHRGFAPPTSYNSQAANVNRSALLHVPVRPPQDIRTLRAINKVIERVLEHGPEFEALLMSRPQVQREENWAWIWDARSEGGIWYRWRLWEVVTGSQTDQNKEKYFPLFEGSHAWKRPEKRLPFEYTTKLDEFVSNSDYDSSEDEDVEAEGNRDQPNAEAEKSFLNPLEKAKLAHFLARLPTNISRLRKGDVARLTTFAMTHASRGVDEVVNMIISNVEKPFSLTAANPDRRQDNKDNQQGTSAEEASANEGIDASAASLVGLYVVSDILSSSATSGVRHAWRFRQLFEAALRDRKVFERLGMMAEKQGWGRLRADKWKRSVMLVLSLWDGWCVFPAESQELFVSTFENPPSSKIEEKTEDASKRGGKWKVVEKNLAGGDSNGHDENHPPNQTGIASGRPEDDIEGEPIDDDDVAGEPLGEQDATADSMKFSDDVEGEPIDDDDVAGEPIDEDEIMEDAESQAAAEAEANPAEDKEQVGDGQQLIQTTGAGQPRRRMRAVDMFADSDASDGEH